MQSLVLSVLLIGLIPVLGNSSVDRITPQDLSVASPSPLLAALAGDDLGDGLSASGLLIVDLQSGQKLDSKNAAAELPIASLTKLMTALIIAESYDLAEEVEIRKDVIEASDGTVARLPVGKHFTVGDLLSAMLVGSANDAADTLATFHSGSRSAFVREMNDRARVLGLLRTSFANPSGLDAPGQWSTAQDIAWLATFALRTDAIRERLSLPEVTITSLEGDKIFLSHTHALLHVESPVIAGKTGTTLAAKQCLLSVIERKGRQYLIVLLHSEDRYQDMQRILRYFDRIPV